MMTIKESLKLLSTNEILKPKNTESISQTKIINHSNEAYKLDISPNAISLLNSTEKQEIALINPDVLAYTQNLELIKKR